jgi:hypothetical protein
VAGLAGKALQLRVFAPLLFISAPPVPLNLREENEENEELRCLCGLLLETFERPVQSRQTRETTLIYLVAELNNEGRSRSAVKPQPKAELTTDSLQKAQTVKNQFSLPFYLAWGSTPVYTAV